MSFRKRWYVVPHTVGTALAAVRSGEESLHRYRGPPPFHKGGSSPLRGLCTTVWLVQNPTALGRFVNRPYNWWATVGLSRICKVARAGVEARPYELCFAVRSCGFWQANAEKRAPCISQSEIQEAGD